MPRMKRRSDMTDNSYKIALDELFEDVLDNCLARVLEGRASVDKCCAASPGFAAGLRPLLETALAACRALGEDVPVAARESAEARESAGKRTAGRSSARRRVLRPLALASGAFLLLFAGTAMAANGAGPDSMLYPLKQKLEEARTDFAWGNQSQARIENGHANARLDELQSMVDANKPEYIPELLGSYESSINAASAYAAAAAADGEDVTEINGMIEATRTRHAEMAAAMANKVPPEDAKALRDSADMPGNDGSVQQPQAPGTEDEQSHGNGRGGGDNHESGGSSGGDTGNHDSGSGDHHSDGSGDGILPGSVSGSGSHDNEDYSPPSSDAKSIEKADRSPSNSEGMHPDSSAQPHSGQGNHGH